MGCLIFRGSLGGADFALHPFAAAKHQTDSRAHSRDAGDLDGDTLSVCLLAIIWGCVLSGAVLLVRLAKTSPSTTNTSGRYPGGYPNPAVRGSGCIHPRSRPTPVCGLSPFRNSLDRA